MTPKAQKNIPMPPASPCRGPGPPAASKSSREEHRSSPIFVGPGGAIVVIKSLASGSALKGHMEGHGDVILPHRLVPRGVPAQILRHAVTHRLVHRPSSRHPFVPGEHRIDMGLQPLQHQFPPEALSWHRPGKASSGTACARLSGYARGRAYCFSWQTPHGISPEKANIPSSGCRVLNFISFSAVMLLKCFSSKSLCLVKLE